ncbi:MAG: toxin-activating lysine-acyltransferase [Sulfuriflexus sp.]|nr:toxin-activating lysine-acyltransferase [Sulfuriflexus sp.]
MNIQGTELLSPSILGGEFNESEVLGSAVWLWMQSDTHKEIGLKDLPFLLLPAIKLGQFVLAIENGKPVFFLTWAEMNEEAEARYLGNPPEMMSLNDWKSGERIWFLDWVAPFGHTRKMYGLMTQKLFSDTYARSLYHRGYEKGLRVQNFHGNNYSATQARHWFNAHPVMTLLAENQA